VWDSEKDAVEFAGAFARTVSMRDPAYEQQPLTSEPVMTWKNEKGTVVLVEKKEHRVLLVSGFGRDATAKIRDAAFPQDHPGGE